jgi:hypothetical protein
MRKLLWTFSWVALLVIPGRTEIITRDLGFGLTYFRPNLIATDLTGVDSKTGCVLDLRYAKSSSTEVGSLGMWLAQNASTKNPALILTNEETGPEIRQLLSDLSKLSGVLTLGPIVDGFTPDIVIKTNPAEELLAYQALSSGTDIMQLITTAPIKIRHDEAAIMAAKNSGEGIPPEPAAELSDEVIPNQKSDVLIDSTLQRATQIHRGWVFLRGSKP